MKKDWEIKKLGELTLDKMSYGTSSPSCEYDGETRYIRITDINDNGELNEDFVSPISYEEKHVLQDGDIVFARTGATVGKAYCYHSSNAKYVYAGYLIRLRPNKKIVLPDYIFYYTKSKNYLDFISASQVAAAQPNVNAEKYSNLEIPLPPLEEQKRIVKILDEKFAQLETIKTNAQTNLQNAKDLFQSQLAKVLSNTTWEKKKMGEVFEMVRGPFGGSLKKECFKTEGYPVYEQQNAIYSRFSFRYFIDESKYREMVRFTVKPGDFIMSCSGTLGKVSVVPETAPIGIINQALLKMTPIKNFDTSYIKYYMYSPSFMESLLKDAQGAAIQNVASVKILKEILIPLPPLPEQKCIVKELDALSEKVHQLQEIYTKQIANCDELKQSLLQKAFEGEL